MRDMTQHRIPHSRRLAIAGAAGLALLGAAALSSCGTIKSEIAEEAAVELAHEAVDRVSGDSTSTISAQLLQSVLDDIVGREIADPDAEREFRPSYTGIVDADGDGFDDDGRVNFSVRDGHACITIINDIAQVGKGRC